MSRSLDEKNEIIEGMLEYKDIKTVLDIGACKRWSNKYKTIMVDCLDGADVKVDFHNSQKLPFEDNSFDLVMANQILEHLSNSEVLISEMKRIAKKYIFVGLPNELNWKARIKLALGKPDWSGYTRYCHRHFFTIKKTDIFVKMFFGEYCDRSCFEPRKYTWFPKKLSRYLANNIPALFSKEVYYLLRKKDCKEKTTYDEDREPLYY